METKKIIILVLFPFFVIQLSSCDLFESTTVSSKEIKKASSWSKKDQPPSYPECESLDKEEQLECFQNIVSDRLMTTILEASFVASTPFEESIDLTLKVDKNGAFSLVEAEIPNNVLDALPYLESTIEDAIAKLPNALPATKTKVGVNVDIQFKLPILISAQSME